MVVEGWLESGRDVDTDGAKLRLQGSGEEDVVVGRVWLRVRGTSGIALKLTRFESGVRLEMLKPIQPTENDKMDLVVQSLMPQLLHLALSLFYLESLIVFRNESLYSEKFFTKYNCKYMMQQRVPETNTL